MCFRSVVEILDGEIINNQFTIADKVNDEIRMTNVGNMPKTIIAASSRRKAVAPDVECPVQVCAEAASLGGAVLLAVCMLLSAILVMAMFSPSVTSTQRFIAGVLVVSSWAYFLNSCTEKLCLIGKTLKFQAKLSRSLEIPLDELETMTLTHEGFNLERGIETIEFRRTGMKPEKVSLGPCWQKNKLESFMKSVKLALQAEDEYNSE